MPSRQITRNIALPQRLRRMVARKVASGKYRSESEVIYAGLRLLESRDREAAEVHAAIERGWRDAEENNVVDGPAVFAEIRARSRALRKAGTRK